MDDCILADCYKELSKHYIDKVKKLWIGELYELRADAGSGFIQRLFIEPGIELAVFTNCTYSRVEQSEQKYQKNMLEITCIVSGHATMRFTRESDWIKADKDTLLYYDWSNRLGYYDVICQRFSGISVYLNMDVLKSHLIVERPCLFDHQWLDLIGWMFRNGTPIYKTASSSTYRKIARQLMGEMEEGVTNFLSLKSKVFEFLSHALKKDKGLTASYQECRNYKRIIAIKERIEHNLGGTLIVSQLAKEFYLSSLELQEGFKQVVGSTVYRYIQQQRMKKASHLLQTTNFSITRIANEVGYDNPSKFTSAFKKIMFDTPFEYRKKFQE